MGRWRTRNSRRRPASPSPTTYTASSARAAGRRDDERHAPLVRDQRRAGASAFLADDERYVGSLARDDLDGDLDPRLRPPRLCWPPPGRPCCPRRRRSEGEQLALLTDARRCPSGRSRRPTARHHVSDRGPTGGSCGTEISPGDCRRRHRRTSPHRRGPGAPADRPPVPAVVGAPIAAVEFDGWDNRTFRLGSELTIRLPSGGWYAQQVDKEQRWLPLLPRSSAADPDAGGQGAPTPGSRTPGRSTAGSTATSRPGPASATDRFATTPRRVLERTGPGRRDRRAARPDEHNFFRGGPLATHEEETLEAIDALGDEVPRDAVQRVGPTP